jgi:hypothetical protein
MWLVDMLRTRKVILITARSSEHREQTMNRIKAVTGWEPAEAYFNEWGFSPPESKLKVLRRHVYPRHGKPAQTAYLALESNTATRAMYRREGIRAIPVPTTAPWTAIPEEV